MSYSIANTGYCDGINLHILIHTEKSEAMCADHLQTIDAFDLIDIIEKILGYAIGNTNRGVLSVLEALHYLFGNFFGAVACDFSAKKSTCCICSFSMNFWKLWWLSLAVACDFPMYRILENID